MGTPLQLSGSIRTKTRLLQCAQFAVLAALGTVAYFQARTLIESSREGPVASRAEVRGIESRLNNVSSAITDYIQNHDAASLERIKAEGREANRLLAEHQEQLAKKGKHQAGDALEEAQDALREATGNVLTADQEVGKIRQTVQTSKDALADVLARMQGSLRANQLYSSRRGKALRAAKDESENDIKNEERFKSALGVFAELSHTRRAERWARQAQGSFDEVMSGSADLARAENKRKEMVGQLAEKRKILDKDLSESSSTPFGLPNGSGLLVSECFLIAMAGLLILRSSRQTDSALTRPLQEILQCVEAAAAGDTSRQPDHWSKDEVGQLSQAVSRLISVLARSENLVYHLAALVESSGDAIISHNLDGTILSWNKGAQRIYGYSADDMKGRAIAVLSPHDGGAEMMHSLNRIRRGERLQPFETLHIAQNGRRVRAFVRAAPIFDSTRKVIGASFVAQDLSDAGLIPFRVTDRNRAA